MSEGLRGEDSSEGSQPPCAGKADSEGRGLQACTVTSVRKKVGEASSAGARVHPRICGTRALEFELGLV